MTEPAFDRWLLLDVGISGRTAVECTRDQLADAMAADIAAAAVGPVSLILDLLAQRALDRGGAGR